MTFERLKILLVDDNAHMRALLSQILRAIDVRQIVEASDGAQALALMREDPIDIVITDLSMQPLDGIDFVRLLRNSPDSPAPMCPVIMVTGHSTMRRIAECRDAGVNEMLVKPVTAHGVLSRVAEVIEKPRPFIRTDDYFGPDRRRKSEVDYAGPLRRANDKPAVAKSQ